MEAWVCYILAYVRKFGRVCKEILKDLGARRFSIEFDDRILSTFSLSVYYLYCFRPSYTYLVKIVFAVRGGGVRKFFYAFPKEIRCMFYNFIIS